MSRLMPPSHLVAALACALPAALTSPVRAADVTTCLPDGTVLVVSVNVKQLLQAPLVRSDEKAYKQMTGEAAKALNQFGVDPAKDLDRVVLAASDPLKPAAWVVLILGRFDPDKVQGRMRELAKERKGDVQAVDAGGATVFECRLPRPATPNPTFTPPGRFDLTVLDSTTVALALDRSVLTEALAKKAGRRKGDIRPRIVELVHRMNPQESMSVVYVRPGEGTSTGEAPAAMTTITGGITLADGVKSDFRLDTKDAESAKRLATSVSDGIKQIRDILPGLAALQPGVGRKEQEMIREMLETIKVAADGDAVAVTSTISKEWIEKNARKDQ